MRNNLKSSELIMGGPELPVACEGTRKSCKQQGTRQGRKETSMAGRPKASTQRYSDARKVEGCEKAKTRKRERVAPAISKGQNQDAGRTQENKDAGGTGCKEDVRVRGIKMQESTEKRRGKNGMNGRKWRQGAAMVQSRRMEGDRGHVEKQCLKEIGRAEECVKHAIMRLCDYAGGTI